MPEALFPAELIEGVRDGIQGVSKEGTLIGCAVTDCRVTLIEDKYHTADSDRRTFSLAGSSAFRDAMRKVDPKILDN